MSQRPFSCFGEYQNQRSNASQRSSLGYGSMHSQPTKEPVRNEAYARYLENARMVRTNDSEETKRAIVELSTKVDSLVQNIEKKLDENGSALKSSVVELEKSFESQIKEIDQKCSQLNQTLVSITELIKEQGTKETRNQEVQTEKVITVTVQNKQRKRKSMDHNRTFHHPVPEKKNITGIRLRSNSTSERSSETKRPRCDLRMQYQRRRLAEMSKNIPKRVTRSSPRIERCRADYNNNNRSILSSSESEDPSVQEISGYVNHHSTPLKPEETSPEIVPLTRRTPKRYIEFTSESDTE